MLQEGRLPLTAAENDALDTLVAKHPSEAVSATRRDAGETGPLLVHVGAAAYLIDENGRARKQRRAG